MRQKMMALLFVITCMAKAGDGEIIVDPAPSPRIPVTVTNFFTTVGRAVNGERCVIMASSRAQGFVRFGEGFTGNFEGDAGSKSFRVIEFIQHLRIDMTITSTHEVPNLVTARQRFFHCHVPYELPYIRVELVQWVDCFGCTATNKK